MMQILTDTDEEAKWYEVETVSRNGKEEVVEVKCDRYDKEDAVKVAEIGT